VPGPLGAAGGALPVVVSDGNAVVPLGAVLAGAVRSGSASRAFGQEECSVFITRKMPQAPLSSSRLRPE